MRGVRAPEPPHAEVVRRYVDEGWTLARLASQYRMGGVRVRALLRSQGVIIRTSGPPVDPAEVARRYNDEGWTQRRLAKHYRIGLTRVGTILREQGATIRHRGSRVTRPNPPPTELARPHGVIDAHGLRLRQLDPHSHAPRHQQITDQLTAAIDDQRIRPGEKLPSQQELADFYGVTRETIKKVMLTLMIGGLVETVAGSGAFVRAEPRSQQGGPADAIAARPASQEPSSVLGRDRSA